MMDILDGEVVAWIVKDTLTIREDVAAMLGWSGATVGIGRAIPLAWSPILRFVNDTRQGYN